MHCFIGNIIRCCDKQFIASRIHECLKHFRHCRIANGRASADRLSDESGLVEGCRLRADFTQVFSCFNHPVTYKQILVLTGNRPFKTDHQIDPGGIFRFDAELGVGTVLTATICNMIVNNDNLAVIAQIDTALEWT